MSVPNTSLPIVRNSERGTHKRCDWKWARAYVDTWRPTRTLNALWLGTGVHEALAQWYQPGLERGELPDLFFEQWATGERRYARNYDEWDETKFDDLTELGVTMLQGYVAYYGEDDHMDIIATEQTVEVVLPHPKTGAPAVRAVGTFDGVYRDLADRKRVKLLEHKTAKAIMTGHLPMDDQASTYWLLACAEGRRAGWLPPDGVIGDIMYNFLRKGKPDERPKDEYGRSLNKDGTISKNQPQPLFKRVPVPRIPQQREALARRIVVESWVMERKRDGRLPILKTPTRDCQWDCPFRDPCELDEMGQDWETNMDMAFTVGDPYEGYRKSTDE